MRIPIIKIRQSWDRLVSTMGIAVITMKSFYWTQPNSWWRHQMETFSALLAFCEGNSPVTGEFPSQRPVVRRFDVFFDVHPNKRLNKPSRHRWFETPSRTLWCHRNVTTLQPPTCSVQIHHPNQCWHITIKIQMTFFLQKIKKYTWKRFLRGGGHFVQTSVSNIEPPVDVYKRHQQGVNGTKTN